MGISPIFHGVFGGGLLGIMYVADYHEYDFWGAFFLKISTVLLGDLRGNYVRTKEIPDNTYPVRLEFELNDYTALSSPVIYGLLDAPRGKAFTHEKFIEYCKNHQVGEEDSDEPDLFS